MQHEWKIGDWLELRGQRFLVYRVDEQTKTFWAIPKTGGQEIFCDFDDCDVKWLEGCDSWDWQPPKPIEPPEGYRLLSEDEVVQKDDARFFLDIDGTVVRGTVCASAGKTVAANKAAKARTVAYARKITPQVRPMTRDEFLAAWKQRGFCPLINSEDDYDIVTRLIIDDCDDDQEIVQLNGEGWCSFEELSSYKFATDNSPLTVKE